MTTYVALLRGINVGGNRKVPMARLREVVSEAGFGDVRTYIQSGNIVVTSPSRSVAAITGRLEEAIAGAFGFSVPVVVRSAAQLDAVLAGNPFLVPRPRAGAEHLHVMFLSGVPDPPRVAALDPERSPHDEFELRGQELYLHCPRGVADSKLTNDYLVRTLGVQATGRNWRTVTALHELAAS